MEDNVRNNINVMPPQHISSIRKTPLWGRNSVMAIKGMSSSTDDTGRTSRENKEVNYDLVNSIFKEEDFDIVTNPYGVNMDKFGGTATKMQNYNIIRSRLETLKGEEMNSPLNYFVYATSGEAVSAKKQKRKDVLKDMMKAHIRMEFQLDEQIEELETQMAAIQEQIGSAQDQAQVQQMQQQLQQMQQQRQNLPDVQAEMEKFNSKYVDPTEQTGNKILKYLVRKDKLNLKFNQGWFHGLVSSEEIYYTGLSQGHPSCRVVNPLQFDYDKGANTTFIHKGSWAKEEYWLPVGEVIDEYGDVLTDKQVRDISSGKAGYVTTNQGMQANFAYSFDGGQRRTSVSDGRSSHVYVMKAAWRSYSKIGLLAYMDERSGKQEEFEVDDTFKMTPELEQGGATIDWHWESEIWEGTLIGDDIFINVRPLNNQTKNLPYIGYIYNNVNSTATSMVDLVKSHQYTYITVWYRLEQELAKAKGRKFVMDMAQLPKSQGWDVDKWMYYFENMGVVWINSKEEGRKGDPSSVANFNQFQSIDMTLSQVVGQYMQVLDKLEFLVEDIMGVSPQRMGDVGKSETATGAQTSIARSTNVTKPWFFFHDLLKEEVLNEMVELAKIAYIDGKELELVLDEFEVETLRIDGDKLNGTDLGVYITNSYEDRLKKDKMEALLSQAVQQGKASLLDMAKVIESDSMSYVKSTLEVGEQRQTEQQNSQMQSNEKMNADNIKAKQQEEERARAHELEIVEKNIQKDLLIKKMDITQKTLDSDDSLKSVEALTKANAVEDRLELDKTKESNRASEKGRDLDLKEKEGKHRQNKGKTQ